jgi:hypothetical protein
MKISLNMINRILNVVALLAFACGLVAAQPGTIDWNISLGMKQVFARAGDTVAVPVFLSNHSGLSISACRFTIVLDKSVSLAFSRLIPERNWIGSQKINLNGTMACTLSTMGGPVHYSDASIAQLVFKVQPGAAPGSVAVISLINAAVSTESGIIAIDTVQSEVTIIEGPAQFKGDINRDGKVDAEDAGLILKCAANQRAQLAIADACTLATAEVADLSANAMVTAFDAALVLRYSYGLMPNFAWRLQAVPLAALAAARIWVSAPEFVAQGIYRYTIRGRFVQGLIAAEITFVYDTAVIYSVREVRSSLPGAIVATAGNPGQKRYSIAIMTSDAGSLSDADLATVTVKFQPRILSAPLQLVSVQLNEGCAAGPGAGISATGDFPNGYGYSCSNTAALSRIIAAARVQPAVFVSDGGLVTAGNPLASEIIIRLFNASGRFITQATVPQHQTVAIAGVSQGSYVFRISGGNGSIQSGALYIGR